MSARIVMAGVAALIALAGSGVAQAGTLATNFATNDYGRQGIYFDLTTTRALTINDFVVNGTPGNWSVYYADGPFEGIETDPTAWTLLGTGTTSATIDTLKVGGITIGAGYTLGFYIVDHSGAQNYTDGRYTYANDDLRFDGGVGNWTPFDTELDDRSWSGAVDYVPSPAPEPVSWALMLGGFGAIGGAMRARRKHQVSFG